MVMRLLYLPPPGRAYSLTTQVRRGKGDNLEFIKFCKELMETKLTDVVHKADIENVGEPVAAA